MTRARHRLRENRQRTVSRPTHDEIAACAYDLFLTRGSTHGQHVEDWLQAERELRPAEGE
jgi:Protein of unknown function (DUF2934)